MYKIMIWQTCDEKIIVFSETAMCLWFLLISWILSILSSRSSNLKILGNVDIC